MYLVRVFSENEAVDFVRGLGLVGRLTPLCVWGSTYC